MNYSYIPETSSEWFDWLQKEEQKTRSAYLAKPATLISDYNKEIATTKDYEGREILELLQNATDQAREAEVRGQIIVEVFPEGLVVANSGAAFSVGGVSSLETANLSPKRHKRRQFIGNKGLGFRSVLNWTHEPMILSGGLGLAYSDVVSEQKLNQLLAESDELADLVSVESSGADQLIVPVLPFPGYKVDGTIEEFVDGDAGWLLLQRCESWRSKGYSTAIGMPFARPEFFDEARRQIDALRPEILLFVDHLDEVRFISPGVDERVWNLDGDDDAAMVSENGEPLGIWQIHRKRGEIPSDMLDLDQTGPLDYEIIIAIPEVEASIELKASPLFSHFPTEISLPLPVVCHATLELNQSRNHTQQRASNRFVLERLAEHLAEVAEQRAKIHPMGPKAGYRMLRELGDYPSDLERESFPDRLIEAAKQRSIVPTLCEKAVIASKAFLVPGANNSWLPASGFPAVVPIENNDEAFFKLLGVSDLDVDSIKKCILELKDLSMNERVALIEGLVKNRIDESAHTSSLLLDASGGQVPNNTDVFISPSSGEIPVLPPWMTLRFLNQELQSQLMDRLETADVRELQGELTSFGLLEYSLGNLIRRLITSANRKKKSSPDIASRIDHDLLVTVLSLYQAEGQSGKRPAFPDKVNMLIPSQAGKMSPVGQLYLGAGYGSQGNIMQALYVEWAPEKLAVAPDELSLECDVNECMEFLQWLGVSKWPREIFVHDLKGEFCEHVLQNITYPAVFSEHNVGSYEFAMLEDVPSPVIEGIRAIDGLTEILTKADAVAISAWLAADERSAGWGKYHADNATLSALGDWDRKRRSYQGTIPNYIRWKI